LTKSLAPLAQQPTEVPTSGVLQLGKQQTRFMLGDLTPTELQQYEQIYPLVQQAYRSGQKITGDKNIVDINKLDSLKGLSSEEKDLIKKFSLDYAEQTTGTKAVLNAATGSGPKQFMGSLPNEAKGLLSQNLVRAGKVGDIDVDFYGGALSEGEKVTNALNKLGKHKWVFDDTIGKVSWISGKETKTVFNFLGDDIPGAYLQYTPMGTIQKPAEVIKYTTDKGLINVATKSTADSFADKFEAGYGAFYGGSKGSQLIVSPDKLKNIGDLDSFVKVLNEKGIISADTGKVTKLLQVRNPNVDFTTPLVITRPTPLPIVPIGTEATSTTKLFKLFESTPTPRLPSATTPQNVLGGGFSNELMTRKSPFLETPGKVSSSTSSGTTNIMGTIADIEKSYSASSVSKAELPSFSGQSSGGGRSISASISSMMSSSYSPSSSEAPSSQTPSSQSPSSETPSSRSSSASSVSASPSSSSSGSSAYPPGVSMGSVPWPSLGSLGGQEGREGPRGSMSRGVSEHFLRNFFFEKAGSTSTPTKKIPIGNDLKFNLKITDMMGKTIAKKKGKLTKSTKTITIPSTSNIFKSENINNRFKGKI